MKNTLVAIVISVITLFAAQNANRLPSEVKQENNPSYCSHHEQCHAYANKKDHARVCPTCNGKGKVTTGKSTTECGTCNGTGKVQ
jgi:DnaJ-class molecular chaperone